MTAFTAPPDQNDLRLNAGDRLDVFNGGVATDTIVLNAIVVVHDGGLLNDISFLDGSNNTLSLDDPSELTGTIAINPGVRVLIEFPDTVVTDATVVVGTLGFFLSLTFGDQQTAFYQLSGLYGVSILDQHDLVLAVPKPPPNGVAKGNPHLDGFPPSP
jgi:autotransporter passenger strand-loop-strand repeat protein